MKKEFDEYNSKRLKLVLYALKEEALSA